MNRVGSAAGGEIVESLFLPAAAGMSQLEDGAEAGCASLRGGAVEISRRVCDHVGLGNSAIDVGEAAKSGFAPRAPSRSQFEHRSVLGAVVCGGAGPVEFACVRDHAEGWIQAIGASGEVPQHSLAPCAAGLRCQLKHGTVAQCSADGGCAVKVPCLVESNLP